MSKRWPIRYRIDRGEFTREELNKDDAGGCDALVLISIMGGRPGQWLSQMVMGFDGRLPATDGRPAELDSTQLFKAWVMLTKRLGEMPDLHESKREFCQQVFGIVLDAHSEGRS